jgi:hypothetical protein
MTLRLLVREADDFTPDEGRLDSLVLLLTFHANRHHAVGTTPRF